MADIKKRISTKQAMWSLERTERMQAFLSKMDTWLADGDYTDKVRSATSEAHEAIFNLNYRLKLEAAIQADKKSQRR
ncbi:hypothetical protein TA3x_005819 (plasmid) [Tundrisphaera sp. TA3]|uniref:hypothetical protein n=1 Tax=Tundrisphaera sp. TA3 TaxID=3435775 RepID=UPI003EBAF48F